MRGQVRAMYWDGTRQSAWTGREIIPPPNGTGDGSNTCYWGLMGTGVRRKTIKRLLIYVARQLKRDGAEGKITVPLSRSPYFQRFFNSAWVCSLWNGYKLLCLSFFSFVSLWSLLSLRNPVCLLMVIDHHLFLLMQEPFFTHFYRAAILCKAWRWVWNPWAFLANASLHTSLCSFTKWRLLFSLSWNYFSWNLVLAVIAKHGYYKRITPRADA